MTEELVVGKNIGALPDIFDHLVNDNKILKIRSKGTTLNEDYLYFLKKIENGNYIKNLQSGDVMTGKVVEINKKEVIIDINYKDNVFVDAKTLDADIQDGLQVGSEIEVMITEISDDPYFIRGSVNEIRKINVSNKVRDSFNEKTFFYATTTELIPAGYMLDMEVDEMIVKAFMPNTLAWVNKLTNTNSLMDKRIPVMIETLEQDKGIYVVSHKKYLETLIPEQVKKLKKEWMKNRTKPYVGFITGTTPFGVFVEFYEFLTGMIYRKNIQTEWQTDEKWAEMKPGMYVNFYISNIIVPKNKIIMTQILRESIFKTLKVGDVLNGKVIDIKSFGALIQLDEETNGLIQSNILSKQKVDLKVGERVDVKVLSIMKDDRKVNLGLNIK
jgi:small subunit ribosomal protein S1